MLISKFFQKQRRERLVSGTRLIVRQVCVIYYVVAKPEYKIKTDIFTFGAASMYLSFISSSMKFLPVIQSSRSSIDDMRSTSTNFSYFVLQMNWKWLDKICFFLCMDKSTL